MAADQQSLISDRKIALLIDADNIAHTKIAEIIAELSKYGTANVRRAYGDWSSTRMQGWSRKLHEFAIRPIQQFSYTSGKNATDIALVIDAMELLYTQKLDAFCIASSDGDFTPLAMQLKANGHEVYGFGSRQTPLPFVNACSNFLYIEAAADAVEASSVSENADTNEAVSASKQPKAISTKALSQDTKLVTALRGAIEASIREDGWAAMSAVGNAVKRQAPIDPRNYGLKTFTELYEKTKLFRLWKSPAGNVYVADARNKESSDKPNL